MIMALMITERCDFYCAHCMVNSTQETSLVSDDVLRRFYSMLEKAKPDKVILLGGEPLLYLNKVEEIVAQVKTLCNDIEIFSNGSFLLDDNKAERVKNMNVDVIISDDIYHRQFWKAGLENLIYSSGYKVLAVDASEDMIPVGRAYEKFKHLKSSPGCSLLTGNYGKGYKNAYRYMVMMNGDVNLYCFTLEGALANVFDDENVTYDLLVKREKILHKYLFEYVIESVEDTYTVNICNMCSKYKVTENAVYRSGELMVRITGQDNLEEVNYVC